MQLSDPTGYEGGTLITHPEALVHTVAMPRERGSVVVLPAWTCHEVEPITAGERWSLVVSGYGPQVR